jgi:GNAT superfamily N-acetyltransferase
MGERLGWSARQEAETWRAWPARDQTEPWPRVPGLTLDVVRAEALEQLLLVQLEGSPKASKERVRRVWSCLCRDADCCCLIAHVNGEPAACLACVWRGGWGSVESVETREPFRRRGICTAMMLALQRIAVARGAHGLYLYDVEPGPDRIYARVGFELVARTSLTSLWLEPPPLLPGCGTPPR